MLAFVLLLSITPPDPIPLDRLSLDRARLLDGKPVLVSLLVAKPAFTWRGVTIVGAADRPDDVERTAHLIGHRFDVEGKRTTFVGTLRVIDHPVRVIGREVIPRWVEMRVEQGKPR